MAMPIYFLSPADSLSLWERGGVRALVSNPAHATPLFPSPSPKGRRETIRANDFIRSLSFCSDQLFGLNRSQCFNEHARHLRPGEFNRRNLSDTKHLAHLRT